MSFDGNPSGSVAELQMPSHPSRTACPQMQPSRTACPRMQGAQRFCVVERRIRSPELQARRASPRPWPTPAACWQTRRPLRRPVFNRTSRFSERQQRGVPSWHGTPRHDRHSAFRASPKLETAMNNTCLHLPSQVNLEAQSIIEYVKGVAPAGHCPSESPPQAPGPRTPPRPSRRCCIAPPSRAPCTPPVGKAHRRIQRAETSRS